jgi:hypothetical protein
MSTIYALIPHLAISHAFAVTGPNSKLKKVAAARRTVANSGLQAAAQSRRGKGGYPRRALRDDSSYMNRLQELATAVWSQIGSRPELTSGPFL